MSQRVKSVLERINSSLKPSRSSTLVILVLIPLCHITAHAVSSKIANIAGTVVDQTGATLGDTHVVLLGAVGMESQRSITDQSGRFNFDSVLATDYVIRVEKNGFREVRRASSTSSPVKPCGFSFASALRRYSKLFQLLLLEACPRKYLKHRRHRTFRPLTISPGVQRMSYRRRCANFLVCTFSKRLLVRAHHSFAD